MSRLNCAYFTISNSPGTSGALTVSAAVDSTVRTLGAAQNGQVFDARIFETGVGFEIRTGCTYTHSGTSLSRGTLEDSSTGSALNFTSAAKVMVVESAATFAALDGFLGAWGALGGANAITGTATALIGRLNVCSGTSTNYTVTLPAVSGNAGKYIGFLMDSALTRVVTLDGNGTELIDRSQTLPLLADDAVLLYCNGTKWISMSQVIGSPVMLIQNDGVTTQSLTGPPPTKITAALTTVVSDRLGEWDATNKRYIPKRLGKHRITLAVQNDSSSILALKLYKNGAEVAQGPSGAASAYQQAYAVFEATADTAGDYFEAYCYTSSNTTTNAFPTCVQFIATYAGR
jgi:hypothetical protein